MRMPCVARLGAMTNGIDIRDRAERLRAQLKAKLGVRGRSLDQALSRAGRRLPRSVRAQARICGAGVFWAWRGWLHST